MNSSQLSSLHLQFEYIGEDLISDEIIDRIILHIKRVKNIHDPFFYIGIKHIFDKFNNFLMMKKKLETAYLEAFDKDSKEHVKMLLDIWFTLKGNYEIELKDKKWCIKNLI